MNEIQERHNMLLNQINNSQEEWLCPTCGRKLLISWNPTFKKTVLSIGDEYAIHSGGKGGLQMGGIDISFANDAESEKWWEQVLRDIDLDA